MNNCKKNNKKTRALGERRPLPRHVIVSKWENLDINFFVLVLFVVITLKIKWDLG